MAHSTEIEIDDRRGRKAAPATAWNDESLLDHHVEELLGAFSDLARLRPESDD